MTQPANVGDGILAEASRWSFGGEVHRIFDVHVRRSIPGYDELHKLTVGCAGDFVRDGSELRDLGCSTGTLSARLSRAFPTAQVLGIDIEPRMLETANCDRPDNVRYLCADIRAELPGEYDFAAMCYTLQFLPVADRLPLLKRLCDGLNPGGGLLLAEKVKRRDPLFEADCQRVHRAHKLASGFSVDEIAAKARSIQDVLIPLFEDENPALLRASGFGQVQRIFHHSCFDAWLAVK